MPTIEQLAAMPKTPGSVILARANGSQQVHAWELDTAGRHWLRFNDRRSPTNLNLVQVLYVAPDTDDGPEVAA